MPLVSNAAHCKERVVNSLDYESHEEPWLTVLPEILGRQHHMLCVWKLKCCLIWLVLVFSHQGNHVQGLTVYSQCLEWLAGSLMWSPLWGLQLMSLSCCWTVASCDTWSQSSVRHTEQFLHVKLHIHYVILDWPFPVLPSGLLTCFIAILYISVLRTGPLFPFSLYLPS